MSIPIQQVLSYVTGLSQTAKARRQFWNFPDEKIRRVRSKLKTTDLKPIGITTPLYINDSLCFYYKTFRSKCKKLFKKFIFGYWISVGSTKIKTPERSLLKLFYILLIWKSSSHIIHCSEWPCWVLVVSWDKIYWVFILLFRFVYFCMGFILFGFRLFIFIPCFLFKINNALFPYDLVFTLFFVPRYRFHWSKLIAN